MTTTVADGTPDTLVLRGRQASTAGLVVRRRPQPRFVGPAFRAVARATSTGWSMAFIRCDLGSVPADHHTLAVALQPRTG
ncbi:MAG TPA: hypothetical protein VE864_06610 [Streptosporangiaceae bacterium]|nr:hypothetical protein [Streptosporangiaceae bacterium]